jgi:hypothetical protein
LQRVFHGIRFKVNEDWLSRDNLLFLKQVFGLPGTCFSFVKALTLRFIYRKSSLLLLGKQSLLLLWEALSWQLFLWQRSPHRKANPLSLPISTAGQRWTPALPVCLCEPAQAKDAGLCALRAPCLYIGFGADLSLRYAFVVVRIRYCTSPFSPSLSGMFIE